MNVIVVGTGMISRIVSPFLTEWGCPVCAVVSTPRSFVQAQELCAHIGGSPYDDLGRALESSGADTVYIATPTANHYAIARRALGAGMNVIVEKPLASNVAEAHELARIADRQGVFLFEATSTMHQPNFATLAELLPRIGDVRVVSTNYSQYSSRYDAFRAGSLPAAFDPACSGGAIMDLGLYCFTWIVGLFGSPERISYTAHVERGVDTSGVAVLEYDGFSALAVAAKDCAAPAMQLIEGTDGCLVQRTPPNMCGPVELRMNDGSVEEFDANPQLQWEAEFREISRLIGAGDRAASRRLLETTLEVSRLQTEARLSAGIVFPADKMFGLV